MKRRPNPTLAGSLSSMLFLLLMSVATAGTNTIETPTYSTADGKHRGDITVTPLMSNQVADKMGKFRLSYSLWTLVGEPVQDYLFSWDWPKGEITVGNAMIDGKQVPVTTKDLAKYPDLLGRFVAVKPVGLTLTASIDFYPKGKPGQAAWAGPEWVGRLTIKPDFIQAAGKPGLSFSPGSPDWADFFSLIPVSHEPAGKAERARLHKKIWAESREVRLRNLEITQIEWPDGEFTSILRDYARLESQEGKIADTKPTEPKEPKINPFELAIAKNATKAANPFENPAPKTESAAPNLTASQTGRGWKYLTREESTAPSFPATQTGIPQTQTSSTSAEAHSTHDSNTRVIYAVVSNWLSPVLEHRFHLSASGAPGCEQNPECREQMAKDKANQQIFNAFQRSRAYGVFNIEWSPGTDIKAKQFEVATDAHNAGRILSLGDIIGKGNFNDMESWAKSVADEMVSPPPGFRFFRSNYNVRYYANRADAIASIKPSNFQKIEAARQPMRLKDGKQ
ncbi:MAG: hypothetical protein U1F81_03225 [Verrucomicrobiaceae bacterium]